VERSKSAALPEWKREKENVGLNRSKGHGRDKYLKIRAVTQRVEEGQRTLGGFWEKKKWGGGEDPLRLKLAW